MKGIREAALNQDGPESAIGRHLFDDDHCYQSPHHVQASLFDEEYPRVSRRELPVAGQLRISVTIDNAVLGDIADEYSPDYDPNAARNQVEAMARQTIEAFAKDDFASRYTTIVEMDERWDECEVTMTLTPIK